MFGYGKLGKLPLKISLDKEMEYIMADKMNMVPEATIPVKGRPSFASLFKNDKQFLMYKGV